MTRLAALDLGSNSFHLLVADTRPRGRIKRVRTKKHTIRIGEPVARTGRLGGEAMDRALGAIDGLIDLARDEGAEQVAVVATEALRAAEDGSDFVAEVDRRHGLPIQLLAGTDEAALSLRGMSAALNLDPEQVVLGLDMGGGSFEIAVGGTGGMLAAASMPLGGAKLLDHLSDPPRLAQLAALHALAMDHLVPAADKLLAAADHPEQALQAIATAGSIRDLSRLGIALTTGASPARVRGMMVSRDSLELAHSRLCSVDVHERMDLPGLSRKRADLLPAAGVPVLAAMEAFGLPALTLCDWGLREGVLLDVVGDGDIVEDETVVRLHG